MRKNNESKASKEEQVKGLTESFIGTQIKLSVEQTTIKQANRR